MIPDTEPQGGECSEDPNVPGEPEGAQPKPKMVEDEHGAEAV